MQNIFQDSELPEDCIAQNAFQESESSKEYLKLNLFNAENFCALKSMVSNIEMLIDFFLTENKIYIYIMMYTKIGATIFVGVMSL